VFLEAPGAKKAARPIVGASALVASRTQNPGPAPTMQPHTHDNAEALQHCALLFGDPSSLSLLRT
jgi:hypothetical protein